MLPQWAQITVALGTLIAAVALLWAKVVRPVIRIGSEHDQHEQRLDDLERRVGDLENE